jgi:hypothetical protein
MAINEEHRQADVAAELEATARTLAHSTRAVPVPADSYLLVGELSATAEHLVQVCQQLAVWHEKAAEGVHFEDERDRGLDGTPGTEVAAAGLREAAAALDVAATALRAAHSGNGVVSWYTVPRR